MGEKHCMEKKKMCITKMGASNHTGAKAALAKKTELGYPELCHNRLDCFCLVLNLVGVEQN